MHALLSTHSAWRACSLALVLAGLALSTAAQSPAPFDPAARAARQKVEKGVKGKLWANASDVFALCLNGKKIIANETELPKKVTLKPGDILTARVSDKSTARGFALIFLSENERAGFSSHTGDWFAYKPAADGAWWLVPPAAKTNPVKATKAADETFKGAIEESAGTGCEGIWGDPAAPVVYLYKEVRHEDIME